MWDIHDEISGEIISTWSKEKAISIAERRVQFHNSEFSYRHRGKHVSANARYVVDETNKKIKITNK